MPASTSCESARSRCAGGAVEGSVRRHTSGSTVGTENVTDTSARRAASTSTSTSRTIIGPRVMIENGFAAPASTSRHARVSRYRPSAGWYGSVAAPIATCSNGHDGRASSAPQHLGDVHLHADRPAVAVVEGPVGAVLERADVAEGAAVDAPRVGVERPVERHPAHAVERRPAPLLAILDSHVEIVEHTFDGVRRITLPMTGGPRHVHCYVIEGDDGPILVDTGYGGLDSWPEAAAIVLTHMHPDHVGGAQEAHEATGAEVHQGALDYAQTERVWGSMDWPHRIVDWFEAHGVPPQATSSWSSRATRSGARSGSTAGRRSCTRAASSAAGACSSCPDTRTGTSRSSATAC